MHKRGPCRRAVSVRLSFRLSVTLVGWCILSERINISSKFFHHWLHTLLVFFPYQTLSQYADGNPSNGGVECRWGRQQVAQLSQRGRACFVSLNMLLSHSRSFERVCTISATNHIGHDHIGHTKRPCRPKGITISATKNVLLFSVNIYKLSV